MHICPSAGMLAVTGKADYRLAGPTPAAVKEKCLIRGGYSLKKVFPP